MDIQTKLRSILAPSAGPVNRAHPATGRPATSAGAQSFAKALQDAAGLEDPSIGAFGVLERLPRPVVGRNGAADGIGGPTISPDIPIEPTLDLPADLHDLEILDTLESLVVPAKDPEPESEIAVLPVTKETRPVATERAAAAIPTLPPIGVLWAPLTLRGSGASGAGIGGTDAATQTDLQNKIEYYTNPGKYGLTLNQEARLFLDAADKGYVPRTAEGLGTLLAGLGQGALGPAARPPQMTEYFRQFYHTEQLAARNA